MGQICKKCGSNIPEGSKFCIECGAKYEAETAQKPKCAHCGAELKVTSKFCPVCGKAVSEPDAAEEKAAAAAPVCAYCGGEIKTTSKFCPHCGKTVGASIVSDTPTAQNETISHMQQQAALRGIKVAAPINNTLADAQQQRYQLQTQPQQPQYPPQYGAQYQQPTAKKRVKPLAVLIPVISVVLVAAILFTGLVAPGWMKSSGKPGEIVSLYDDDSYVELTMPEQTEEQKQIYTAANMSLQAYINARLWSDKLALDAENRVDPDELAKTLRSTIEAWHIADTAVTATGYMGAQLSAIEDDPAYRAAISQARVTANGSFIIKASAVEIDGDAHEWAEQIRKYYEQCKDGKKVRQMASILKTDTRTALESIEEAERILKGDYKKNDKFYTACTNTCRVVKTGSKCIAFGLAVASTGGVGAALSGGVLSAGATIGSGVDCLVDLADTSMTVTLGEDHRVTVAVQDVKSKLAPVTSTAGVVGLFIGNWSKAAEIPAQLHYIQDSYNDLKNDGKILGFQVLKDENGKWKYKILKELLGSDINPADPPEVIDAKLQKITDAMNDMGVEKEEIKEAITPLPEGAEPPSMLTELENMALDSIKELISASDVVTDREFWMESFKDVVKAFEEQMEKLDDRYDVLDEADFTDFEEEFFIDDEVGEYFWNDLFLSYEDMEHAGDSEGFDDPSKWVKPDMPGEDWGDDDDHNSSSVEEEEVEPQEPVDSEQPSGVEIDDSDSIYQVIGTYVGTETELDHYEDMEDVTIIEDTYYAIRYDGEQLYLIYPHSVARNYDRRAIPIEFNSIAMTGTAYLNDPDLGPEDYNLHFKVENGQMKLSMQCTNYWDGDGDYTVSTFEGVKVSDKPEYIPSEDTNGNGYWNKR